MISANNDGLEDFIAFLGDQCGPLLETARIYAQELLAARARIAELEGDLNIARLQRDAKLCSECPRAPLGLSQEERLACLAGVRYAERLIELTEQSWPIVETMREHAAILRRLGGQTI